MAHHFSYLSTVGTYNQLPTPNFKITAEEFNQLLFGSGPLYEVQQRQIGTGPNTNGINAVIFFFRELALVKSENGTHLVAGCQHKWKTVESRGFCKVDLCQVCGSERNYSTD